MATADPADELKKYHAKYWNDLLSHKFILEMAADSLPIEKFAFYLRQDHVFLKEFCAFLLIARQKSTDQKLKIWFDRLYHSTVDTDMQMQKELLISLGGISNIDNNSNTTMASATLNYISFLRQVSLSAENLEGIVSAMAPCPWSYLEIAQKLCKGEINNKSKNSRVFLVVCMIRQKILRKGLWSNILAQLASMNMTSGKQHTT
jgi:thiaminase/transcriptional activator TenA